MKTAFLKREDCPSSYELVAFQKRDLASERDAEIRLHLESCDFCGAETELYELYPSDDASSEVPAEIPAPLFELAEALLLGRHADPATLNALLKEKDDVIFENA